MANGLSSLYICQALFEQKSFFSSQNENIKDKDIKKTFKDKDFYLISIDPYQSTQWKNAAVKHLEDAKLQRYNTLIKELDAVALPEILSLVSDKKLELFDFIFIDGDHKFDYTLLDFMYADMMLKVGGVIVVDDVLHDNVKACMNYIDTNYKHFKKLKGANASKTMNLYVKIEEDKRTWDFHVPFRG